jgi:hypothetical protein
MENIGFEKAVEVVVSRVVLVMLFLVCLFQPAACNERLLLRRQVRVIGKEQTTWPRANGLHLLIQYLE